MMFQGKQQTGVTGGLRTHAYRHRHTHTATQTQNLEKRDIRKVTHSHTTHTLKGAYATSADPHAQQSRTHTYTHTTRDTHHAPSATLTSRPRFSASITSLTFS